MSTTSTRKKEKFLRLVEDLGNITLAAQGAGVGRRTVYGWRAKDPDFASRWDAALEIGGEALEDEARRRAMESSDTLLIFMLKALKPERYNRAPIQTPQQGGSAEDLAAAIMELAGAVIREREEGGDGFRTAA